jgi:hypothetical protein
MTGYNFIRRTWIALSLVSIIFTASTGCLSLKKHALGIQDSAKETGGLSYEMVGDAEGE